MINCKTAIQNSKTAQGLSLPDKLNEILPLCKAFQAKPKNAKIETDDWHVLCHKGGGFKRWHKQQFFPATFVAAEFSALAARAYLALAELDNSQIPHFAPLSVTDVVKWARQGNKILPLNVPLPGVANNPLFRQGLADLQLWRPRDLPKGITGHGDPVRRWLINKLLEEFYYSFALAPSKSAIRDVVLLAWANVDAKSIRYVMDDDSLRNAEIKANTRREFDNKAKTVTQQSINRFSVQAKNPPILEKALLQNDQEVLKAAEQLLSNLSDEKSKIRALSLIRSIQEEMEAVNDDPQDEWTYS
ncbi:hypothetical protein JCM14076_21950 [Methylosoma difficile]